MTRDLIQQHLTVAEQNLKRFEAQFGQLTNQLNQLREAYLQERGAVAMAKNLLAAADSEIPADPNVTLEP